MVREEDSQRLPQTADPNGLRGQTTSPENTTPWFQGRRNTSTQTPTDFFLGGSRC